MQCLQYHDHVEECTLGFLWGTQTITLWYLQTAHIKKNSNLSASYSYNIKVYMRLLSPIIFCIMSLNFFLWSYEVVYLRLTALFTQKRCHLIINGFTFYVQFKCEFDTSWLFQGVIVPLFLSSVNGNKMFWLQKWNETYKQYLKGI